MQRDGGGKLIFLPHLSNGAGGFVKQTIVNTGVHYNGGEQTLFTVLALDLNGDGLDDLVHVRTDGGGNLIFLPHLSNSAGGFVKQPIVYTGDHYNGGEQTLLTVLALDLNGDKRKDLVHVRTFSSMLFFLSHLANGTGGFEP